MTAVKSTLTYGLYAGAEALEQNYLKRKRDCETHAAASRLAEKHLGLVRAHLAALQGQEADIASLQGGPSRHLLQLTKKVRTLQMH